MNRLMLLLMPALLALTGCSSKQDTTPASESLSLFTEGKGIWFSDETRKLLGVEVVEAVEKPMQRHLETMAQVYRAESDGRPAAATMLLSVVDLPAVKLGQPVTLKPAPGSGAEMAGKLVRFDAHAEITLGQVETLVEFPDPAKLCAVGTSLVATFKNGKAKPAFAVPKSALLTAADGNYLYVVNGTHLTRTPVKTGAVSDGFVEIVDGLYAGDSVAATGVLNLWLVELSAMKGGTPCCAMPKKTANK
jgi:multidrug efflux pump subunit AcrA (membrane-fusion protein)